MRLPLFIAKRYFLSRKGSFINFITIISVLGVAVGVAALIIALSISTGFTETMKRKLGELYADLNIVSFSNEIDEKTSKEIIENLKKNDSVKGASPIVLGIGLLSSDYSNIPKVARVVGIEKESFGNVVALMKYVKGSGDLSAFEDGSKGAIIGKDLADSLGVEEGDTLNFLVPKMTQSPFGAIPRVLTLKITGVLKSDYYLYDTEFIYLDFNLCQKLFTAGGVHSIQIRLKNSQDIEKAKIALEKQLDPKVKVLDLMETNREFFKALKMERLLLFFAIGLIVVVAALNIVSTLILLVMEKIKDIGILRSVGVSSAQIRSIFLFEGMMIGITGTILGDILGTLSALLLNKYKAIPLSLEVYPIPYVPFETSFQQVIVVTLFALAVSFVSTLYPSKKASNLLPLEALRYE
ncbi:MAG: ABC transporter permease [Acidobacteria bacterium]|nr:ABC transporter permease [Acidobacteriota bacterium]